MNMKEKINFAIIGCGRISYKHLSAISELSEVANLIAVCDIDEDKALQKASEYKVPHYLDYHQMLKDHPEIDIVNVCTPSGYHAQHVIDIAQYGVDIITEKPMALTVEDCEKMIQVCYHNRVHLFVIYQNRFNPPVIALKEVINNNRIGELFLGTVRVRWSRRQEYYDNDNWHGTWELDGGVMSQQASHHIDLLQYLLGPVETLQCLSKTSILDIEVEDTAVAMLKFKSGALGVFEATVATRPDNLEGSLSVLGSKGSVVIGGHAVNEIKTWKFEEPQETDESIIEDHSIEVPNVYGFGHTANIEAILSYIRDGVHSPVICDAHQGKKNIELLSTLYESAACNGVVLYPGVKTFHSRLGEKNKNEMQDNEIRSNLGL